MILRARWLIPVASPILHDGFVEISGTRIVRIGSAAEIPAAIAPQHLLDLGDCILTPGLINPHTHLELAVYAGRLRTQTDAACGVNFWEWLNRLVARRSMHDAAERETDGALKAGWDCLRAGVTCIGDISRRGDAWRSLKRVPIRKVCFTELISFASEPPRSPDELRTAVEGVEEDELLTVGVSPHAPYSVSAAHTQATRALAARLDRPWTMHWCETPEEAAFLSGRNDALPEIMRELQQRVGISTPRDAITEHLVSDADPPAELLAHGNYLSDADLDRFARLGRRFVHCPRAHRFFGHPDHPLPRMRAAGVRLAVGTDSPASNDGLDPLGELREIRRRLENTIAADDLFTMITRDAAAALGLQDRIGALAAGRFADLAAFACPAGIEHPLDWLIDQAPPAASAWVGGRRVI